MVKQLPILILIFQVALGIPHGLSDKLKNRLTSNDSGLAGRPAFPFLPTPEGESVKDVVDKGLRFAEVHSTRRPRALMSILSLLWPQVVGPMHDGIIHEQSFEELPKTPLEHHLDSIRERSSVEVATRQHVRDMLNQGPPPGMPMDAHQQMTQLHLLHQLHPGLDVLPLSAANFQHAHGVSNLQALFQQTGNFPGFHNVPGFPIPIDRSFVP